MSTLPRYWNDIQEDMDRKRRRQAEFLMHKLMPWYLVTEIVVMKKSVERMVQVILDQEGDTTVVRTERSWYY